MKTKILKLSLLTAVLGIALWSCKKDESNTVQNKTDLLSKIELQTNEFNSSQNLIQAKINWKNVMKIAGADLLGALGGGVSGAAIGTALPGVGNAAGATIGMIVGGVGGSLKAAERDITNSNIPSISKQILLSTMSTTRWDVDYWLNANIL